MSAKKEMILLFLLENGNFEKFFSRIFRLFTSKFLKHFISSFSQFENSENFILIFSIKNFTRGCTQSNQRIIMSECKFIRLNYIPSDFATFFKRFAVIQIGICLVTTNCIRKKTEFFSSSQIKL